jgi:hypothetical protein
MVKENQNITIVDFSDFKGKSTLLLSNCIIDTVNLIGVFELETHLVIENCVINNFNIHSCWFLNGLVLKNSIVRNSIDYQMGGHNMKPIILEGNIFLNFFNFFDCQFENTIELKSNIFMKGANLLGNQTEGFANNFAKGYFIENNIGNISLNES